MSEPLDPVPAERASPPGSSWLLAIAALALGYAVQVSNGNLHPDAIAALSVAFLATLLAVAAPGLPITARFGDEPLVFLLGLGLVFQMGQLFTSAPGIYLRLAGGHAYLPFFFGLCAATVLAAAGLGEKGFLPRVRIPLLLVVHFALGVWLIHASPDPFIDVFVFQRDASRALLHGQNPYAITFPDIYGNSPFYGAGLSVNGRLTFGFPYPPLSLLLALPGYLLGGDYRYAQLVAITGAGALMAYARPGRVAPLAAALFLFTPRFFFVLEQGWTEPFVVLLLAAVVYAALHRPKGLPWALGLFLAVKQYLVFAVFLAWLLIPREWRSREKLTAFAGRAVGIAAVVTLPFVLWGFGAFWRDVVGLQVLQPFRVEALSYLAWWTQQGHPTPPTALAFVAALLSAALCLWRAPRTPAGFAMSNALVFCAFFAFNKQAFCNYYYFVVGALWCAVAARGDAQAVTEPT